MTTVSTFLIVWSGWDDIENTFPSRYDIVQENYPFPIPALSKTVMYVVVALGDAMTSNRQCVFLIIEEILKPKYKQIFQWLMCCIKATS